MAREVVYGYVRTVAEVDAREQTSGHHYEGALRRSVPGILVDDDVAYSCLARDELRDCAYLLNDHVVRDRRRAAAKDSTGHESGGAITKANQNQESYDD